MQRRDRLAIIDVNNNVVNDAAGTSITLTESGGTFTINSPQSLNASGQVNYTVQGDETGSFILTASDGSASSQLLNYTILPAPLSDFTYSTINNFTTGQSQSVTITAKDAFNNVKRAPASFAAASASIIWCSSPSSTWSLGSKS